MYTRTVVSIDDLNKPDTLGLLNASLTPLNEAISELDDTSIVTEKGPLLKHILELGVPGDFNSFSLEKKIVCLNNYLLSHLGEISKKVKEMVQKVESNKNTSEYKLKVIRKNIERCKPTYDKTQANINKDLKTKTKKFKIFDPGKLKNFFMYHALLIVEDQLLREARETSV